MVSIGVLVRVANRYLIIQIIRSLLRTMFKVGTKPIFSAKKKFVYGYGSMHMQSRICDSEMGSLYVSI